MKSGLRGRVSALFVSVLALSLASAAQGLDPLVGVWGAKRDFGSTVRGRLEITRSDGNWRVQIAQYDQKVEVENDQFSFELPGNHGRFKGRAEREMAR
jgi:hypothetical protein